MNSFQKLENVAVLVAAEKVFFLYKVKKRLHDFSSRETILSNKEFVNQFIFF